MTAPRPSADGDAERAELLALLRQRGILYESPTQPVLSRDGTSARWMLDSLAVTLTPRGAELAGRCVLRLLERFDGRQLATYGTTGIPILQSAVLQSGGRYRGLLVRKERKPHGSRKLIEGDIDSNEPIIIIDDSVSSGTSMFECVEKLEAAGLRVEGGLCLVRFGWYGGFARMLERGYQMESVYDIWTDFIYHMEDEAKPVSNPCKAFPEFNWSSNAISDGIHPAQYARAVIKEWVENKTAPRPPARFDRDYDHAGGIWVSVRARDAIYERHARDGFWHFPGEAPGALGEDLALAALKTARELPSGEAGVRALDGGVLAVTFFGALEACTAGELDNDRYGIVVRSRERPAWMGGALPRMPGIAGEWAQFQHARMKNARLVSFEPHIIYRHSVLKAVEPGAAWQPSGVPREAGGWEDDPAIAGRVAARAREWALEILTGDPPAGAPLPDGLLPDSVESVFVTIHSGGRMRGCMGAPVRSDGELRAIARAALQDDRFDRGIRADDLLVSVSFLYGALELGGFAPEEVPDRVRLGEQALECHQERRSGLLLPNTAFLYNLGPHEFVREVIDKAGITRPPYRWRRYECATWLTDGESPPRRVPTGLPRAEPPATLDAALAIHIPLLIDYLARQKDERGGFHAWYSPIADVLRGSLDLARRAHVAWILARAAKRSDRAAAVARQSIDELKSLIIERDGKTWLQTNEPATVAELSFLLLALIEIDSNDPLAAKIAATLWSAIDHHGRVATHARAEDAGEAHQDYFPGQLLLALARAAERGVAPVDEARLTRAFHYYRHRFRIRHRWGMASWHTQAFAAWHRAAPRADFARFAFEIADWALEYQQSKTGGFINDHQSDGPGYTTALYLEGIAAALNTAEALGDRERAARYRRACERGWQFLDGLIYQPRDRRHLPHPGWAMGGLRANALSSDVRIDFVSHALGAALELAP